MLPSIVTFGFCSLLGYIDRYSNYRNTSQKICTETDTWPDQLMEYKGNNNKMEALAIAVIMVILSTTTMGALSLVPSNVFAASDKQEETDTQVEESDNKRNDEQNADTESESETETEADSDTETEVNGEQEQEEVVENSEDTENGDTSNTNDIATLESAASNNPNGNDHVPGDNEQPNRVGSLQKLKQLLETGKVTLHDGRTTTVA
jgi:hypothetical protein